VRTCSVNVARDSTRFMTTDGERKVAAAPDVDADDDRMDGMDGDAEPLEEQVRQDAWNVRSESLVHLCRS